MLFVEQTLQYIPMPKQQRLELYVENVEKYQRGDMDIIGLVNNICVLR